MKRTSLADIADALGVSRTLVSMVLNHRGDKNGISKETQARVWEKAVELNYQPNRMARGLRLGKSNTIGLIVADISNSFYARIARSIEDEASRQGYQLLVSSSDEKERRETDLISRFLERQVDGLIIASTLKNTTALAELADQQVPFVLIDRYFPGFRTNYVVVDNAAASAEMVSHLIRAGYRRIALLSIAPGHISTMRDRIAGYRTALDDHNIPYDHDIVKEIAFENLHDEVKNTLGNFLSSPQRVDAVFALNNHLMVACLEALADYNLVLPRELGLASFDDENLFRFCQPPLTAISQPVMEIGKKAFEILILEINQNNTTYNDHQVVLGTRLEARESSSGKAKV
ncbi:MAG: LacI family DNA-binding transcriptional regulator [Bacteroidia bacterium]